ncbi:YeeE/YedE family protein [Litoreibacter arenae]|uniref:Lipocalin-related protein and Bos/Can/Equ allergen n=1 Tax=Litoreibacter arenae DSM 19593 TaxID=1123360 RepID=S9QJ64_9RHOB|nr:YeeE/YedE family protein [Litoreibacter arenae]EPX79862.1 Lipocalin-related protein and Bos/Can/Equ allergen [Litoreibacter arenae DSM 19593]
MLLETYDWGLDARTLQLLFGLGLGLVFGVAAQISRFCLRRAVAGDSDDRGTAGAVWVTAFATAILAFQLAQFYGLVAIEDHRLLASDLAIAAIVIGGAAFGAGMVLTRGCVSRLTVLSATGNLRAVMVLLVFAITAHAMLKGVLAPVRTTLGSVTVELPFTSLADLPGGAALSGALAVLAAVWLIWRFRPAWQHVLLGGIIGLVPVLGWATTSVLLFDEFDPLAVQSAAFTLPWADTLFWVIASTAVPAGFGTGFIGGIFAGSFVSAAVRGELQAVSFANPAETTRYASGAVLMGFGGVLAGGCTVGAGLSGSAALSVAALIALASIIAGAWATSRVLSSTPVAVPA